jgi:NAD+ synthase (glutamine-hydrolysing)
MHPAGFLRISTLSTATAVANPEGNATAIEQALVSFQSSDVVLLPELCISGYTCGELFLQDRLLESCRSALLELARGVDQQLVVVGLPLAVRGRLYNVAAVLSGGSVLGLVPKTHLPNYSEFYEARWFHSGADADFDSVRIDGIGQVPFGTDLLFECGKATLGVEICEDLWVPIPPSSQQAIAGANVLLNLSASNETIGKANYRKQLVAMQSGKCIAAYAYASAGPSESSYLTRGRPWSE